MLRFFSQAVAVQLLLLVDLSFCAKFVIDRSSCGDSFDFIKHALTEVMAAAQGAHEILSNPVRDPRIDEKILWLLGVSGSNPRELEVVKTQLRDVSAHEYVENDSLSPEWARMRTKWDFQIHCNAGHITTFKNLDAPDDTVYWDLARNQMMLLEGAPSVTRLHNPNEQGLCAATISNDPPIDGDNARDTVQTIIFHPNWIKQTLSDPAWSPEAAEDLENRLKLAATGTPLKEFNAKNGDQGMSQWDTFANARIWHVLLHEMLHVRGDNTLEPAHDVGGDKSWGAVYSWRGMVANHNYNNAETITALAVICLAITELGYDIKQDGTFYEIPGFVPPSP